MRLYPLRIGRIFKCKTVVLHLYKYESTRKPIFKGSYDFKIQHDFRFENILSLVFADVPEEKSDHNSFTLSVQSAFEPLHLIYNQLQVRLKFNFDKMGYQSYRLNVNLESFKFLNVPKCYMNK